MRNADFTLHYHNHLPCTSVRETPRDQCLVLLVSGVTLGSLSGGTGANSSQLTIGMLGDSVVIEQILQFLGLGSITECHLNVGQVSPV